MTLRFDGLGAGLGYRSASGDRNDPTNYTLLCVADCGVELGPLSRFRVIADPSASLASERITSPGSSTDSGFRFVRCGNCRRGILLRGTQVAKVIAPEELAIQERAIDEAKRIKEAGGK